MNSTNKIVLELEIPVDKDAEFCEELLLKQTEFLVDFWRDVLARFKPRNVPSIYLKKPKGSTATNTVNVEYKTFVKTLLDHHLQFMPKDNVASQMQAIKKLFATGKPADELIELYEHSRSTYKLTTWHTVIYKLNRPTEGESEEVTFARKVLDDTEKQSIINRLKRNEIP